MKLLWAFDKKWEWINAVAVSARRRVLVILCGYVVSACLVAVLTTHGACVHELYATFHYIMKPPSLMRT
jgi:hypothetical protein